MSQFDLDHQVIPDPERELINTGWNQGKADGLIQTNLVHMAIRTVIINGQLGQIAY